MKRALFGAATALGCAAAFLATPAFAQAAASAATDVVIPYGDLINQAAGLLLTLAGTVLAFALSYLPASLTAMIKSAQLDQLLLKGIDYGINSVAGAEKGKTMNVAVGNAVVAQALQYAVDHGPGWLISWAGGTDLIEQKIIARVSTDAAIALKPK